MAATKPVRKLEWPVLIGNYGRKCAVANLRDRLQTATFATNKPTIRPVALSRDVVASLPGEPAAFGCAASFPRSDDGGHQCERRPLQQLLDDHVGDDPGQGCDQVAGCMLTEVWNSRFRPRRLEIGQVIDQPLGDQ
jgi:hypothetical protein